MGQPEGLESLTGLRQGSARGLEAKELRNPLASDPTSQNPLTFTDPGGPQFTAASNGSGSPEVCLQPTPSPKGRTLLCRSANRNEVSFRKSRPRGRAQRLHLAGTRALVGGAPIPLPGPTPADGPTRLSLPRDGPARRRAGSGGGGGPRWRTCNWTRRWPGWEGVAGADWVMGAVLAAGPPALAPLALRPAGTVALLLPCSRSSRVPDRPSGQGAAARPAGSG